MVPMSMRSEMQGTHIRDLTPPFQHPLCLIQLPHLPRRPCIHDLIPLSSPYARRWVLNRRLAGPGGFKSKVTSPSSTQTHARLWCTLATEHNDLQFVEKVCGFVEGLHWHTPLCVLSPCFDSYDSGPDALLGASLGCLTLWLIC